MSKHVTFKDTPFSPGTSTEWVASNGWSARVDLKGRAGDPGHALDLTLKVRYNLSEKRTIACSSQTVEGGVKSDGGYNPSRCRYRLRLVRREFYAVQQLFFNRKEK